MFRLWNIPFLLLQIIALREGTGYLSTRQKVLLERYHKSNVIPRLCRDPHCAEHLAEQSPTRQEGTLACGSSLALPPRIGRAAG